MNPSLLRDEMSGKGMAKQVEKWVGFLNPLNPVVDFLDFPRIVLALWQRSTDFSLVISFIAFLVSSQGL